MNILFYSPKELSTIFFTLNRNEHNWQAYFNTYTAELMQLIWGNCEEVTLTSGELYDLLRFGYYKVVEMAMVTIEANNR